MSALERCYSPVGVSLSALSAISSAHSAMHSPQIATPGVMPDTRSRAWLGRLPQNEHGHGPPSPAPTAR